MLRPNTRLKFSLVALLAITSVICIALALFATGRAPLVHVLQRVEYYENAPRNMLAEPVVTRFVSDLDPADQLRFAHLIDGSSISSVITHETDPVNELQFMRADLEAPVGRSLEKAYGTSAVEVVRIYASKIDPSCPPFFDGWKSLKTLIICNTDVPSSWVNKIKNLELDEIYIMGDCGPLQIEELAGSIYIKKMNQLSSNLGTARVNRIKRIIPPSQLGATSSPNFYLPALHPTRSYGIGVHRPPVYEMMRSRFERLKQIDTPAKFNLPVGQAVIGRIEDQLGRHLPISIRALLECHNGQPTVLKGPIDDMRLVTIDEIYNYCTKLTSFVDDSEQEFYRDFLPLNNALSTSKEPFFPFAEGKDCWLGVQGLNESVFRLNKSDSTSVFLAKDLFTYFDGVIQHVGKDPKK